MKQFFFIIACLIISSAVYAQFVTVESFHPNIPSGGIQETATVNGYTIDSLETSTFHKYRVRGYLIPPQTGYYKFYLLSSENTFFNLSLDSLDFHRRLILRTNFLWPGTPPLTWPDTIPPVSSTNLTFHKDSVYLSQGKPYYFEILHDEISNTTHYGLKWTLPGTKLLTSIKGNHLKPPIPLHAGSDLDWNIFEYEFSCNFEELRTNPPLPDKKISLQSVNTSSQQSTRDHYSSQVRGYIYPDVSGNYLFYFMSNDAGQFWLSTDSTEINAQLITDITSPQPNWIPCSAVHSLVAGQKYFFEILHYDSAGSDLIKLGWTLQGDTIPEIVSFSKLSGYLESVGAAEVKFSVDHVSMLKNQTYSSVCNILPWNAKTKAVTYQSDNYAVATVDGGGLVTAVTNGECRIIARLISDTTIKDTLFINVSTIDWELFKERVTVNFDSLRNCIEPPDQVAGLSELNTTNFQANLDFYSSRIRGYLLPPVSGNYTFYFSGDDKGQFWLSPDSLRLNAILKSVIDTADYDSSHYMSYQILTAGHKYFFELMHYDSVYMDKIKLCWLVPGDTLPVVISVPYLTGSEENTTVGSFFLLDKELSAYPNYTFSPRYFQAPWNATNKAIHWESSNSAIAGVNSNGEVTTISPGICHIYARMAEDTTLTDTLQMTVTNYSGPYFVKTTANTNGNGYSWNSPIQLTQLLDILGRGNLPQQIKVCVAEGTYKPTTGTTRLKSFIVKNIRLQGGFPAGSEGTDTTGRDFQNHETILSGEIGGSTIPWDNCYHVIIMQGTSVTDGFTITDGYANSKYYGYWNLYDQPENSGGGIIVQSSYFEPVCASIRNCKIAHNTAYNGGGGIYSHGAALTVENCLIEYNQIQIPIDPVGGGGIGFVVRENGYGPGITNIGGICNLKNSIVKSNHTPWGLGSALFNGGGTINIEDCSIFNNIGIHDDVCNKDFATINMINSTLIGSILGLGWTTFNITRSTIIGGGVIAFQDNTLQFDNSIWTRPNLALPEGSTWQAKYSILGDSLFGINKDQLLSDSLPGYATWLDTLAYNGGATPTMRLKNVPGNPAKTNGNPEYLGTPDQRGYTRADTVSIGAYQWVWPSSITITPENPSMAPGDSLPFNVSVLPAWADDKTWSAIPSDPSVVGIAGNAFVAQSEGNARVMVRTHDSDRRDTSFVTVLTDSVGVNGTVHNGNFACYSALDVITVAGNETSFVMQPGSYAEMIAGEKILYLPGATVKSGGTMHGYIAPQGPWCSTFKNASGTGESDEIDPNVLAIAVNDGFVTAWPNPTTGELHLAVNTADLKTPVQATVFSFLGEVLFRQSFIGATTTSISLESLPAGMYLLRCVQGDAMEVLKLVKQ